MGWDGTSSLSWHFNLKKFSMSHQVLFPEGTPHNKPCQTCPNNSRSLTGVSWSTFTYYSSGSRCLVSEELRVCELSNFPHQNLEGWIHNPFGLYFEETSVKGRL